MEPWLEKPGNSQCQAVSPLPLTLWPLNISSQKESELLGQTEPVMLDRVLPPSSSWNVLGP